MGIVVTPKYRLRAPDDTELVRDGAQAVRNLASDVESALTSGVWVSKTGDTMTGPLAAPTLKAEIPNMNFFSITAYHDTSASVVFDNWSGGGSQRVGMVTRAGVWSGMQGSWAPSSRRIKDNIQTFDAAAMFASIRPVSFTYNEQAGTFEGQARFGFIAEEVAEAGVPVISDENGDPQALNDTDLIAVLWAKVREQDTRISDLEQRLMGATEEEN